MTKREFYEAIVNANISDEITAFAADAIAKMDATNEKRRNKPKKVNEEVVAFRASVLELVTSEAKTASDIAAEIGASVQKTSAALRALAADGSVVVSEIKVPKKGTQKAYALAD